MEQTHTSIPWQRAICLLIILIIFANYSHSANIVRPWRSTTAIVLIGESFEVWFNADAGQTVGSIELAGPFNSLSCSYSITQGDWEYDPLSGNRYNTRITVSVPSDAPADRYDLVLKTTKGDMISHGGVKVLKEYKKEYYIMHMSDGHLYQSGYDTETLLARKTAMIDMANILDCQLIIETGDNMYNVRNHPEREEIYFQGNDARGIKGMADASAATFLVPGDHDAYTANDWPQATVQVNSDFFNDYWGMQNSNFKYGNGRFMMLNNGWGVSETSAGVHQYQCDDAAAWLSGEGAGGNFFVTAGHCYNKMHEFINDSQALSLVLAGDKHHVRTNNPYSFDDGSPAIAYIAGSIREHFEFNLFLVENGTGTCSPVSGSNAVVEVLNSGDLNDKATWVPNLSLEFLNDNNGSSYENTATIINRFGFPIKGAKVRFVMPGGFDYKVENAIVSQEFDGDTYHVIDVTLDVDAGSTATIHVGDADLCPDDPGKTEPGLCGCGVEEGTCETSILIVNNGSGDGEYYPYENVSILANEPPEGEIFDAWTVVSGNPVISNPADPSTVLILKGIPAEITATYKEIILVDAAAFVSHLIPPVVPAGNVTVNVTMKNTGTTTWTKAKGYSLGSQNPPDNTTWGLNRVDLTEADSILPLAEKTFSFEITGPQDEGLYNFQWQMVQSDSSWFGEATRNQVIGLSGSEDYLDDCDLQSSWKSSGSLKLNGTDQKQGSNCLEYTGSNADEFKKVFSTAYNPRGSEAGTILQFWYFISDISKMEGSNQVELGSAGTNDRDEYNWKLTGLSEGWNYIRLPVRDAGKLGNPELSAINWFRLYSFKSAQITTRIDGIQLISDGVYNEVSLTVNNGTGSGLYEAGDRCEIRALEAPQGEMFDQWIINAGDPKIDNLKSSITFITLSDTDAEVTANYMEDPNTKVSEIEYNRNFQLYPNPVEDEYMIEFFIAETSIVKGAIYDMPGRRIRTAIEEIELDAGTHVFINQVYDLMPGIYMQQVSFNNNIVSKILIIK